MAKSGEPGWLHALAEVEQAVQACLKSLDKYESAFAGVLAEHRPTVAAAPPVLAESHGEWERRLETAQKHADDVERLLLEQETIWGKWKATYEAWKGALESGGQSA